MRVSFYLSTSGRSPVEEFIQSLPKSDQARFADVYKGIRDFGLHCPRVTFRQLRGKLWEVKFSANSGGYRICYVIINDNHMVWLHAFKKTTQKTPAHNLELAERRMKEIL
ncbi:MAG: type II toxin-antitoxin system RelE/ParE family toxin [Deltaproteobacteria bacterium]|nr:type II toxin-antitoxin system RelE/ParE family toxin [Deltaproteobacteria bacterium]